MATSKIMKSELGARHRDAGRVIKMLPVFFRSRMCYCDPVCFGVMLACVAIILSVSCSRCRDACCVIIPGPAIMILPCHVDATPVHHPVCILICLLGPLRTIPPRTEKRQHQNAVDPESVGLHSDNVSCMKGIMTTRAAQKRPGSMIKPTRSEQCSHPRMRRHHDTIGNMMIPS